MKRILQYAFRGHTNLIGVPFHFFYVYCESAVVQCCIPQLQPSAGENRENRGQATPQEHTLSKKNLSTLNKYCCPVSQEFQEISCETPIQCRNTRTKKMTSNDQKIKGYFRGWRDYKKSVNSFCSCRGRVWFIVSIPGSSQLSSCEFQRHPLIVSVGACTHEHTHTQNID